MRFDFTANQTANTFNSPNTALSGDGWASFLLGAMDPTSYIARASRFSVLATISSRSSCRTISSSASG